MEIKSHVCSNILFTIIALFISYSRSDGCFSDSSLDLPSTPFRGYILQRCRLNHSKVRKKWFCVLVLGTDSSQLLPKADAGVAMFCPQYPAAAASVFLLCSRRGKGEDAGQPRHGCRMYARCCLRTKSSVAHEWLRLRVQGINRQQVEEERKTGAGGWGSEV